jgi:hypothetical protein
MGTKRLRRDAEPRSAQTTRMAFCRSTQEIHATLARDKTATLPRKLPHYPEA